MELDTVTGYCNGRLLFMVSRRRSPESVPGDIALSDHLYEHADRIVTGDGRVLKDRAGASQIAADD